MDYYCDVCDKTIKLKSKNNHLKSISHIQYEKCFRISHTNKTPDLFHVDKLFNVFITNHNKKTHVYLIQCDFSLVFNNDFKPHIKTFYYQNSTFMNMKRLLLNWIDFFTERGHEFSHNNEMNTSTINDKLNMSYENYNKQPMQAVEIKLNVIIAENPNLKKSINRFHNHPLSRKYSHPPFNNY